MSALLAPPSDYIALKAGFERLVNLADLFNESSLSRLAANGRTIKESPQFVIRMARAIVRGVIAEIVPMTRCKLCLSIGTWSAMSR